MNLTTNLHADRASSAFEYTAPERIGRIVAVTGSKAIVLMDTSQHDLVDPKKRAEIGTLLKVEAPSSIALALVSALSSPMPSHSSNDREMRIVEIEFIGEFTRNEDRTAGRFRRGVSNYPTLGDIVCRTDRSELALAYACDAEGSVRVGAIQQDASIPAMVKVDEMLGKHFAILGTTGTGKSCTVALILRRILEKNPKAHILLLDIHREYAQSFRGISEIITPENMTLPFWLLNFDEATEILIGSEQKGREADTEILREIIPIAKARYLGNSRRDKSGSLRQRDTLVENNISVDTPIPYRTSDLISVLDEYLGKLDLKGELAPYKRLKAKLEAISRDQRYGFMFGSLTVQDNMAQVLARIFRIPVAGKPIAILELGGLPSEIINVVVSVLARMAFDFGVWSRGRVPITFVCEEAHRYVPNGHSGFEPTKRAIARIAREGRKYGVSLCMVTQRPAELDPTILSQCSTIFSMRLTNDKDRAILAAGISDAAASLLEFMPTMGAGEAVCFGEGVALPTRLKFDLLPAHELPSSSTASFSKNWAKEIPDDSFLTDVVSRWRAQTYNPDSSGSGIEDVAAVSEATPMAVGTPIGNAALPPAPRTFAPAPAAPIARPSLLRKDANLGGSPPAEGNTQQSLASLIKQFRT